MDLRLYLRVIWRFRLIVAAGFVLALFLSMSSYYTIGFKGGHPSLGHRQDETWQATTVLGLTQGGFPWGRTVVPYNPQSSPSGTIVPSNFADPNRFTGLASYYAHIANSDPIHAAVHRITGRKLRGTVTAAPVIDGTYVQPFMQFTGLGPTASAAMTYANAGADAFRNYLISQQQANGIPPQQRVALATTNRAKTAALFAGRRKTTPIVIFMTVLLAAIGLAFILENLRPRVQLVSGASDERDESERDRRSA